MGQWRYFVRRASTGAWLDTNAQMGDLTMNWALSGPDSGQAIIPSGMQVPTASDGRDTWGKFDTMLFAEEDGNLSWVGICTDAIPDPKGISLDFIGLSGWLAGVDYSGVLSLWRTNVFEIVRHLIRHAATKDPGIDFVVPNTMSKYTVGDPAPPPKPKEPGRRKGEKVTDYHSSARYKRWQNDITVWNERYSNRQLYQIVWWDAPMVGEKIDELARQSGFQYRTRHAWADRAALRPTHYFDFADDLRTRRTDIAFVDGVNLKATPQRKNRDDKFANHVIGLGAGDGKAMLRATVGGSDGRLYQAEYSPYKSITNLNTLRGLASADLAVYNNTTPLIDSVVVFENPTFAALSTLRCGDEVKLVSQNVQPAIDQWVRVKQISRKPATPEQVTVQLEAAA